MRLPARIASPRRGSRARSTSSARTSRDPIEADRVADHYVALAQALERAREDTFLSIDLSHIGLDQPGEAVQQRLERIAAALPAGRRIQVGAEQERRADRILAAVSAVARKGGAVSATVQANLKRSRPDAPGRARGRIGAIRRQRRRSRHDQRRSACARVPDEPGRRRATLAADRADRMPLRPSSATPERGRPDAIACLACDAGRRSPPRARPCHVRPAATWSPSRSGRALSRPAPQQSRAQPPDPLGVEAAPCAGRRGRPPSARRRCRRRSPGPGSDPRRAGLRRAPSRAPRRAPRPPAPRAPPASSHSNSPRPSLTAVSSRQPPTPARRAAATTPPGGRGRPGTRSASA